MKEKEEMRKLKRNFGITLVALVVTIVVLIILATISINIIFGEEGIIERTKQAKQDYANAQEEENEELAKASNKMDEYVFGDTRQGVQETILFEGAAKTTGSYKLNDDYRNYKYLYIVYNEENTGLYKCGQLLNVNYITKDQANDQRIVSYGTRNTSFHFTEENLVVDSMFSENNVCNIIIIAIIGIK